jgi:hypothetical protein
MNEKEKYCIPIYQNGIQTEYNVEGIVGDEKYLELIKFNNGKDLPVMLNIRVKNPLLENGFDTYNDSIKLT